MVLGSVSDASVFYWSRIRMRLMVLFVGWHLDSHWHWTQYNPQSELAQPRIGVMEKKCRWADEQSNLHIYIYSNSLLPSSSSLSSSPRLLLGTADWMCVMSTEFNGELLKVFSKSFVFTKLLFVDHGNAEQLWPVAGPLLAARWNWSIVLSFKQSQDKYHHYSGRAGKL